MKINLITIILSFVFLLSCKDVKIKNCPDTSFSEPFPKRSIDISKRLGDTLTVESVTEIILSTLEDTISGLVVAEKEYRFDTIQISIDFNRKSRINTMIDLTDKDTLFSGFISAYRGYFYMTEKRSDSTYWIGAMYIGLDSIQGLGMIREQMCDLDLYYTSEPNSPYQQMRDSTKNFLSLKPDKKLIKEIYPDLIQDYPKYKIISNNQTFDDQEWQTMESKLKAEGEFVLVEDKLVESLYPNPAKEKVQIDFQSEGQYVIQLIGTSGKVLLSSEINTKLFTLDLQNHAPGFYLLRVYSLNTLTEEYHRIIIR